MPEFRLIHGIKDTEPEGDVGLVGMYDTRTPEADWIIVRKRDLDRICWWAEQVPEVIFFQLSVSLEI